MHVDTDLSSGGVVIVDDYRNLSCPGVTKAVDEFTKRHDIQPLFLLTGQALLFKS